MTDYKILVRQVSGTGEEITVEASEIRGAATVDEAVARFVQGFRNRPDPGEA